MNDEQKCWEALSNARAFVKHKAPYLTTTLLGLVPHTVEGLNTLGVTKDMVLVVDPSWFIKLTLEQQGACLMHEMSHVLRDLERLELFQDKDLGNIALDMPINEDLRAAGWKLPDDAYYPDTFKFPVGLTAEHYYDLLQKNRKTIEIQLAGSKPGLGSGKCGGCAGNPVDKAVEDAAGKDYGRTTADINHIRVSTVREIQAEASRGRGNVPMTLSELLPPDDAAPKNKISWRIKLSRILRRCTGRTIAGRSDYSYKRLARSSFLTGMIKPGMVSNVPIVAFCEDTSGSMGAVQTREVRTQAIDIMSSLGIESAWWISADADVAAPPRMLRMRDIRELPVIGRGGTDFTPAIELAKTLKPRPDILIYCTDGDGAAPELPPPRMEVVFCIVPSYYNKAPVDWGHHVIIQDEAA